MKKIVYWLISTSAVIAAIFLIVNVVSTFILNTNTGGGDDKPYSLSVSDTGSVGYRLGAVILRPLIETRIDNYIKELGLVEYLKSLKAQMPPESSFSYSDVQEGSGPKALCGQMVTGTVISVPAESTKNLDSNPSSLYNLGKGSGPISFRVGMHEVAEINYAVVGMKVGSSRVVVSKGGDFSNHYINLSSIDSLDLPEHVLERFMIFDKANPNYSGKAIQISHCGDKVSVVYRLRDASGNIIIDGKTETFTIGERKVPISLDLAAVDLRSDITRSVIVPPDLSQGFDSDLDNTSVKILDLWWNPSTYEQKKPSS